MRDTYVAADDKRVEEILKENALIEAIINNNEYYGSDNDEDFCESKDNKLNHRRRARQDKRKNGYYNS